MYQEIKKQFLNESITELQEISKSLSTEFLNSEQKSILIDQIFEITHKICGTGPMLGINDVSVISRKIEKTFLDIKSGDKELSVQIILQTCRGIDQILNTLNKEINNN